VHCVEPADLRICFLTCSGLFCFVFRVCFFQYGWLFEDENYAGFVQWMKSVLDYEEFHKVMVAAAKKNVELRASHK